MKLLPLYCLTYICSYPNALSIKETLLIYFKPLFYMLKPFFTNIRFLMPLQLTTFKNIVKKAEIVLNEQFLLLPKGIKPSAADLLYMGKGQQLIYSYSDF